MAWTFVGRTCAVVVPIVALLGCDDGIQGGADSGTGGADSSTGGTAAGGSATGSSGGSSSSGGSGNPGGELPPNDTTTAPEREGFTLLFEDQFESIDTTRWGTASHTFVENAAQFDPTLVDVVDGYLRLRLEKADAPSAEGRIYRGGEIRTNDFFSYGRFEARVRFARGSGIVSSIFTYYDHWADPANLPENWNEIDIEFLGKDNAGVQFNVIHWNEAEQRTTHEEHASLAFDPTTEFHDYAIEWLPDVVNFYVDEELVHSQTEAIAEFLTLDQRFMLNLWNVNDTPALQAWAGAFDEASLPAEAYYDWVRIYALDE